MDTSNDFFMSLSFPNDKQIDFKERIGKQKVKVKYYFSILFNWKIVSFLDSFNALTIRRFNR